MPRLCASDLRMHVVARVVIARKPLKFLHDQCSGAVPAPPFVANRVRSVPLLEVAPRPACAKHEEVDFQHSSVMHRIWALMLVRKHRAEHFPFRTAHVVSVAGHAANSL